MQFFDSHAHLSEDVLYDNIEAIIDKVKRSGVKKIINVCTDLKTFKKGLILSERYNFIYNAAASSPHDVEKEGDSFFKIVEKAIYDKQLIAVGETGLDYYYKNLKKDIQIKFLKKYFALAKKNNLPVIIHCREAFEDLLSVAKEYYPSSRAVLHCFTGSKEEARCVLDKGWHLSFSGIITFKNSDQLREVVKFTPIDKILIETDSPLLAPQSKRGKINDPSNVVEVAKTIANIKNMGLEEVASKTYANANQLFL